MRNIIYIILAIIFGVAWGFIGSRLIAKLFKKKIQNTIVKEILKDKRRFYFNKKQYNLKADLEHQLGQKKKKKGLFNNKMKGGDKENGNTLQSGSATDTETTGETTGETNGELTSSTTSNTETSSRGPRDSINRSLHEKGRILD